MLIQAPNVLLLDEPTNDLDVQTLSVLEDFLEDFRGCVIVVSHDRYFLDRTVDRLFSFEEGRLKRFEGNYSAFLEQQRQEERSQNMVSKPSAPKQERSRETKREGPRRRNFKENKELARLDQQLPELELQKGNLEQQMAQEGADMAKLSLDLADLISRIEQAEERWLELSELAP
jgi:ATP-binding cassette subfamily F protein uup